MFKTIKKILDLSLEVLIMIFVALLVIDVFWQVFSRFIVKHPSTWTEELAVFMLIWTALLGSAVALNRGSHLGIDFLVNKLSFKKKLFTEVLVFLCIAIFSLCVMVIGGIDLVLTTLNLGQISPAVGIKIGYVYLAVPISGLFMMLYSIIGLIERLIALFKPVSTSKQKTTSPDDQVGAY